MSEKQPTTQQVRDALRQIAAATPEAGALLEKHVDALEERILVMSGDDPFRAYMLARAQQDGAVLHLLQRLDDGLMADVVRLSLERAETARIAAEDRQTRAMTTRQVLSQPAVLAALGILSTLCTGALTAALHLLGI